MYVLKKDLEKRAYTDQYGAEASSGGEAPAVGGMVAGGIGVGAAVHGINKFKQSRMAKSHAAELASQAASHADELGKAQSIGGQVKNFGRWLAGGFREGAAAAVGEMAMKNPKINSIVSGINEIVHGPGGPVAASPKINSVYGDFGSSVRPQKAPLRQRVAETIAGKKFVDPADIAAAPKRNIPVGDDAFAMGQRAANKAADIAGKYAPIAGDKAKAAVSSFSKTMAAVPSRIAGVVRKGMRIIR